MRSLNPPQSHRYRHGGQVLSREGGRERKREEGKESDRVEHRLREM